MLEFLRKHGTPVPSEMRIEIKRRVAFRSDFYLLTAARAKIYYILTFASAFRLASARNLMRSSAPLSALDFSSV